MKDVKIELTIIEQMSLGTLIQHRIKKCKHLRKGLDDKYLKKSYKKEIAYLRRLERKVNP